MLSVFSGSGRSAHFGVKKRANILDTTVGYLLGGTGQANLFKDKKMLQRLQDILKLPEKEQSSILLILDHFIKSAKISLL
jgi:vacuolar-type H+-ATPase subunit F/Vma7